MRPSAGSEHEQIAQRYALAVRTASTDEPANKRLLSGPLDLAASADSYSIKNAHALQESAEHWRSYHWQIAAHAPVPKPRAAGPMRQAEPIYAAAIDQAEQAAPSFGARLQSWTHRMLGFSTADDGKHMPDGLKKVGERYGNFLVVGDTHALRSYAESREVLCRDAEVRSELLLLEDGTARKHCPLTGEVRPSKTNFTIVLADRGYDFVNSATNLSLRYKPSDVAKLLRDPEYQGGKAEIAGPRNVLAWAIHRLLQAGIPLASLGEKYQVSLCRWNDTEGHFVSTQPPHYRTPALNLRHELRHIWHQHVNFASQIEARMSTDTGALTNREEAITIREESRVARVRGEGVRVSHAPIPTVEMPGAISVPLYLHLDEEIDALKASADQLAENDNVLADSIARLENRSIARSNPGLAAYRQGQVQALWVSRAGQMERNF